MPQRLSVGTGEEEPAEDGKVEGSFHIKGVFPLSQEFLHRRLDLQFPPEPSQDQIGADSGDGPGGEGPLLYLLAYLDPLEEFGQRADDPLQLVLLREEIHASQGRDDILSRPPLFPLALDDLEVPVFSRRLNPGEHCISKLGY